jgi:hypothetical protein
LAIRCGVRLVGVLVVGLMVAGCGAVPPEATVQTSPLVDVPSPQAEVPASPGATPLPVPAATTVAPTEHAVATATLLAGATQLVILHTNDNWGETEPCG